MPRLRSEFMEAIPIYKLICPSSGATIGYEYRWNTGETAILWHGSAQENFIRITIGGRSIESKT